MLTFEQAKSMARDFVHRLEVEAGEELMLLDDVVLQRSFGWVFFYNTKRFLKTKSARDALAGNGPLLVDKTRSRVVQLGTAHPVEEYLEYYERTGSVLASS
jgi:hypothetical protein